MSILSETRVRRAKLTHERRWRELEALDRKVTDEVRCRECVAITGESCRTFGGAFPETRSPHLVRLLEYDRGRG